MFVLRQESNEFIFNCWCAIVENSAKTCSGHKNII